MLNRIILRGYLGRNPEIKTMQNGKQMATFFLASTFSWKDEEGEWQSHTDWHRVSVFRESSIGWIKDIMKKGDMVYLEGRLSYHEWIDKYQQKRFTPHIIIENFHGRVEHLRSRKPSPPEEESESLEDQQNSKHSSLFEEILEEAPAFINRKREFHTSLTQSHTILLSNNEQEDEAKGAERI